MSDQIPQSTEKAHVLECSCEPPYADCAHPPCDCPRCLVAANPRGIPEGPAAIHFCPVPGCLDIWESEATCEHAALIPTEKAGVTRVLVTGSRDWPDDYTVDDTLTEIETRRGTPGAPFVVVHGACPTGADAYAARWVKGWAGYPVPGGEYVTEEPHPADWSKGRKAGPERNAAMVALGADLCLAFIGDCTSPRCSRTDRHPSHGASGCADLAEAAGIRTLRYSPGQGADA